MTKFFQNETTAPTSRESPRSALVFYQLTFTFCTDLFDCKIFVIYHNAEIFFFNSMTKNNPADKLASTISPECFNSMTKHNPADKLTSTKTEVANC